MDSSANPPESKWEKFKKSLSEPGTAKPWHVLNPGMLVTQDVVDQRLSICQQCDRFIAKTSQCRECGCIMAMKTRVTIATCPLKKW